MPVPAAPEPQQPAIATEQAAAARATIHAPSRATNETHSREDARARARPRSSSASAAKGAARDKALIHNLDF
jgi:hypothetical protein